MDVAAYSGATWKLAGIRICRRSLGRELGVETEISRRALLRGRARPQAALSVLENCLAQQAVACRICEDACDERAIRFRLQLGGKSTPVIDEDLCTLCGDCVPVCPVSALKMAGDAHG